MSCSQCGHNLKLAYIAYCTLMNQKYEFNEDTRYTVNHTKTKDDKVIKHTLCYLCENVLGKCYLCEEEGFMVNSLRIVKDTVLKKYGGIINEKIIKAIYFHKKIKDLRDTYYSEMN